MQEIVSQVDRIKPFALGGAFVALLLFEAVFRLRKRKASFGQRIGVNLCLAALAFVASAYVVKPAAITLARWTTQRSLGLLHFAALPFPLQFILGFLAMDVTFYYWHRVNHTVAILWRFHNVHHIDPDLDVSTSFRFHFVEILYSSGFRVLQVSVFGIAPFTYAIYELLFQGCTMFHHSNLRLPIRAERWLNKIIVTPRMHGVHHSIIEEETNSNYSVIFRWWDALHRTLRLNVAQSLIIIGVANYQKPEDNKWSRVLVMPFRKQRDYWRLPDASLPLRRSATAPAGRLSE